MTQQQPSSGAGASRVGRPRVARVRPERDGDLATHDLTDHDQSVFPTPGRPWRHLLTLGVGLLVVGVLATGAAAVHLSRTSAAALADAVTVTAARPGTVPLQAGEQRMLYTQRDSGQTQCTVTDPDGRGVPVAATGPVLLQGSDQLWYGDMLVTAAVPGEHRVQCGGAAEVRVGHPVGTLDVVLTILVGGIGGLLTLVGLGLAVWGRRRS